MAKLKGIASKNVINKSYIGLGYYPTRVPNVILRNILENPGWYTAYTPYQAEIAQGRLEALLNFQQVCIDLTGFPVAGASLLDEATAAAEAMAMAHRVGKVKSERFFVDARVYPQTLDVMKTRAKYFGFELVVGDFAQADEGEILRRAVPIRRQRRRRARLAGRYRPSESKRHNRGRCRRHHELGFAEVSG